MYPILAYETLTLGIGGIGFRFCLIVAFIWMIRLVMRAVRREIAGERCVEETITLFGLSSFVGLSSVAHIVWVVREKGKWAEVFGFEPFVLWGRDDQLQLDSALYGVALAMLGFLLAGVVYNFLTLSDRMGQWLIRLRYWFVGIAVTVFVSMQVYSHVAKPMINYHSFLDLVEDDQAVDAMESPLRVTYYNITSLDHIFKFSAPPPPFSVHGDVVEVKEPEYPVYFEHQFRTEGIEVEAKVAKSLLGDLEVYRSSFDGRNVRASSLLRFVGRKSVVDMWFSSWGTVHVFVSGKTNYLREILSFTDSYREFMVPVTQGGLRYREDDELVFLRFENMIGVGYE